MRVLSTGVDLAHHLALWDVMSRNAVFLTGDGTNDDHWGKGWHGAVNNWATSVWAPSTSLGDLLAALAAGRAWCWSLSEFGGPGASLDLVADGCCPMGSVSLSRLRARKLTVTATGMPAGGSLVVKQGAVDYAGNAGLTSNVRNIARFTAAQIASHGGSEPSLWTPPPRATSARSCLMRTAQQSRPPTRCGCCGTPRPAAFQRHVRRSARFRRGR